MGMDEQLYRLPLIGFIVKRLYSYFRKNLFITDLMHISLGLGIGFLIVGEKWLTAGIIFLVLGLSGHVYAYVKGK